MKKLILFLCALPIFGAIPATTVWEVRTTGAATNGGGYSSGGTDYSQQNAAQWTVADAVTAGTTTITSATASFTSAIVGNVCYVAGGTGSITAARYHVDAYVSATEITMDRFTGLTAGTGVTLNCGGALNHPATAFPAVVAGNTVWVQAGTYNRSENLLTSANGSTGLPIQVNGYTSSRGDSGRFTIQVTADYVVALGTIGNHYIWRNININCGGGTARRGISVLSTHQEFRHVRVTGCTNRGFNLDTQARLIDVEVSGSSVGAGVYVSAGPQFLYGVRSTGNTNVAGFEIASANVFCVRCIADANTGASGHGFVFWGAAAGSVLAVFLNSVAHGNGGDGLRFVDAASADNLVVMNSIFTSNTGCGINSAVTDWSARARSSVTNNAFRSNTGGNNCNIAAGANDVALGADPFVNAAGGNFALNESGKTALNQAGWPGAMIGGGTGYLAIGPLQPEATGGAPATPTSYPIIQ